MAVNLSQLAPITTTATTLSNLVLVTPRKNDSIQPQNRPTKPGAAAAPQQPDGFLFDFTGDQSITLQSDITDHFVEDNTAIQDQVSLKPEIITVTGYIGELVDVTPELLEPLRQIADKLSILTAYTPGLTLAAQRVYNEAFLAYQVAQLGVNSAVSAWSSITNTSGPQTKQQVAFGRFFGYWKQRTFFTVQTPWAVLDNMMILNLKANQSEETRMITDFEITFKKIQFASTVNVIPQGQGRYNNQAGSIVDGGANVPVNSIPSATAANAAYPGLAVA